MQRHIEDTHQQTLIDWARVQKIRKAGHPANGCPLSDYLIAIPNGGKRNPREAARLKRQGVQASVPDLFLHIPVGGYSGLWIELKRPASRGVTAGRATENQKKKISQLSALGYCAVFSYGFDEAKTAITEYLSGL